MSQPLPGLFRHRPFQIAWVWEIVCVLAGVAVYVTTDNAIAFIALIFMGAAPMAVVMLRFIKAQKAGLKPDRSGDIVQ
ncbi:MAG: hypothetical protein Q7J28_00620 [Caulobacter sp.]|nr:hypothetical protein [Caulobacter sp.]